MKGYSAPEVERMLGLPRGEVRAWIREGLLEPDRGPRGELRFSFQDLVLLRTAKGLIGAKVPRARVRRALGRLRAQLPADRPLSGVHISAEGNRIVVSDGRARWQPESGQALFDFGVDEIEEEVASLEAHAPQKNAGHANGESADAWYDEGCAREAEEDREAALVAYRRAIEIDPDHADAHVNLGRLHHDAGELGPAETHYRAGLRARPDDVTAAFNLGVALEDLGQLDGAVDAFQRAVKSEPGLADAYYNLSRLCEKLGRRAEALRYLHDYRKLTR